MKFLTWFLIVLMFVLGITPRVDAGLSPSAIISDTQSDRASDLVKIQKFIETKLVRERLEKLGFTKDEIQTRLSQLSDQQMHQFAQNLDSLKVGGDGAGVIIALLLIAIFIVLLLHFTGHRVLITK
jgi:hypothetical protein